MIVPANIFVSNEASFAGDVPAASLLEFLEQWLQGQVPADVEHAAGLKVHEVRVTKAMADEQGNKSFKVVVRHERSQASPAVAVEAMPMAAVPPELAAKGFRPLAEHRRFAQGG